MGGMAAQMPIKRGAQADKNAMEQVRQYKFGKVLAGHEGTWVTHPALVSVARSAFDENMQGPNQIAKKIVLYDFGRRKGQPGALWSSSVLDADQVRLTAKRIRKPHLVHQGAKPRIGANTIK